MPEMTDVSIPRHVIFVRYVLFAVIAGVLNLATQELVLRVLPPSLFLSILAGTAVGFIVKYILDKYWIFKDRFEDRASETRKIALYGAFSVVTTIIFWGMEIGFWHLGQTPEAKYIGGALGLAIGNWVKYRLDKHYVFARQA